MSNPSDKIVDAGPVLQVVSWAVAIAAAVGAFLRGGYLWLTKLRGDVDQLQRDRSSATAAFEAHKRETDEKFERANRAMRAAVGDVSRNVDNVGHKVDRVDEKLDQTQGDVREMKGSLEVIAKHVVP